MTKKPDLLDENLKVCREITSTKMEIVELHYKVMDTMDAIEAAKKRKIKVQVKV
jgi:hypothetical protein